MALPSELVLDSTIVSVGCAFYFCSTLTRQPHSATFFNLFVRYNGIWIISSVCKTSLIFGREREQSLRIDLFGDLLLLLLDCSFKLVTNNFILFVFTEIAPWKCKHQWPYLKMLYDQRNDFMRFQKTKKGISFQSQRNWLLTTWMRKASSFDMFRM